jgi:hypothetical protein
MTLVRSIVDGVDGICRARTTDLAAGRLAEAVTTSRSFGEESELSQTRKSARLSGKSVLLPPTTDLVGPLRHVRIVPIADVRVGIMLRMAARATNGHGQVNLLRMALEGHTPNRSSTCLLGEPHDDVCV